MTHVLIYCNSLSGAVDLPRLRRSTRLPIITPLDAYRQAAQWYQKIGLLAANCQSTANIERVLLEQNPAATVIGYGNLSLVQDVEAGVPPEEIVARHHLPDLVRQLRSEGCEVILIACTHFPYFLAELEKSQPANYFEPGKFCLDSFYRE